MLRIGGLDDESEISVYERSPWDSFHGCCDFVPSSKTLQSVAMSRNDWDRALAGIKDS